eukprot:960464_1
MKNNLKSPPPAPIPFSPPSQNDIHLSPASADPYSIPDTPYISAHSNKTTDGNASYDPKAFDSEYEIRDLSQLPHDILPEHIVPANISKNNQQPDNKASTKSICSKRCIIISIVIISIIIITATIIGISLHSKSSKTRIEKTDELRHLEQELSELEQQYHNDGIDNKTITKANDTDTTQQNNTNVN